ncbi:stage III sporulation protein AE [Solibacillus sp. MA9]|uniref:Stage III sporulation protein AE n=1 Tax=Solibacillus palustris TaxID=2908203 RepID=A0ABS9UBY2_9BACL|nr:stage III sporulation protein AE [Solibacillus sp. MA9]MCH7321856.1 stage III sporulation protein AE [Solibacillus sp. MA9]
MEDFLGLLATPLQSIFSIILLSLLYVGAYLLFVALLPNEMAIIEQLFILLFIVSFAQQVIDAFVVLYELISILQSFFVAVIPILSVMLLTMQSIFTLLAWNPIVIVVIQFLLFVSTKLLIPSLIIALLLDISTKIFPAISFARASDLLRSSVLSFIIAAIVALTSILTFSGAALIQINDAVKSPIKKLIEQNIPLIGNLIVEGLSFFQKSQSIVSSFIGVSFLAVVFSAAFAPAIMLLGHALTFKVIGAIIEPFTNTRLSALFDDVGKTLFVACAVSGLLGFAIVFIVLLCIFFVQTSIGGST